MVTSEPEDHLVCSFECRRRHPRGERGRGYPRCLTLQRMGIVTGPDYSRLECVRLFYFFLCLPGVYLGSLKVRVCSASAGSAGNPVSASGLRSSQACAASYSIQTHYTTHLFKKKKKKKKKKIKTETNKGGRIFSFSFLLSPTILS
ncbi:Protein of unknown function [Cotesia congregata]|uniref:Uncharacterized protein n=1 Tax=Cotesia congregata TaxID=51543 RepID=A0A8J2MLB1_COTCN|nr:Protein of unknown function [Cotesia congregata]